ncbi:MAG TPA: ROK family protein, partial [Thermomicrobiales bacterium]|nr:ROK family protein [Thermomicrobiales bacterium]
MIGVDLGGTRIRVALISESGTMEHRLDALSRTEEGALAVVRRIGELVGRLAAEAGVDPGVPVGIGSPGPLNPRTGEVLYTPNLPGWRNVPIVRLLEEQTGRRVTLANDGNCGTLGEMQFGSAKGVSDLVYIALGTGV